MQNFKEKLQQLIEEFKILMSEKENRIIAGVFLVFVFLSLGMVTFASFQRQQTAQEYTKPITNDQAEETPIASIDPDTSPSPTASGSPTSTPKPSASPTPSPSPSPSPSPTPTPRTPNPARFRIAFPSENQLVEVVEGRTMCAVPVPEGGDSSGTVLYRVRKNGGSWSEYRSDFNDACYTPNTGDNTLEIESKNKYGETYNPGVRKFKYQSIKDLTYTINATTFADHNCNTIKDSGDEVLTGETRVHLTDKTNNTTLYSGLDPDGSYSYSANYPGNETRHIEVDVIKTGEYKSNPNYDHSKASFVFSKDTKPSFSVEIPSVPYADVGNCSSD